MSNPVFVNVLNGVWTLVALNVTGGMIYQMTTNKMLQTYRMTGDAAPTLISDGVNWEESLQISNNLAIDVYIWSEGDGKVRVDL